MVLQAEQIACMSRLLDDALPLDAAGRLRWLERLAPEHCPLVPALRQALFPTETDGTPNSIDLETLPKIDARHDTPSVPASGLAAGGRVGPYQLVRLLGVGGMAEVWLAHRTDSTSVSEVALKVPILSPFRPDLPQRFARECEILARLEHPHIVRFQDAGFGDDGLPYVAMERVPGEPLTDWCDRRRLGLRERITLFLQVLDAVQHAHARQVIHRDLKPANILVTNEGEVRLLDFGAAKLLSEHYERDAQVTRLYGPALTPNYASPELVRGEPLATTSDIYSLGIVLYELLTGSRPYRIKSSSSCPQVEHAISTARIVRPSARSTWEACSARGTSKKAMVRELRGELDAIVLKALSLAPEKRYSSVSALAGDLQRHLGRKPVGALLDWLPYWVANFLYRYSTDTVIALAALALTVAVNVARFRQ
jgi:serine/threonine protein kinase